MVLRSFCLRNELDSSVITESKLNSRCMQKLEDGRHNYVECLRREDGYDTNSGMYTRKKTGS